MATIFSFQDDDKREVNSNYKVQHAPPVRTEMTYTIVIIRLRRSQCTTGIVVLLGRRRSRKGGSSETW